MRLDGSAELIDEAVEISDSTGSDVVGAASEADGSSDIKFVLESSVVSGNNCTDEVGARLSDESRVELKADSADVIEAVTIELPKSVETEGAKVVAGSTLDSSRDVEIESASEVIDASTVTVGEVGKVNEVADAGSSPEIFGLIMES